MDIMYRKGTDHANADAMSRDKCGRCTQCMMDHEDAKVEKIKTRLLAMVSESQGKELQKDNAEITECVKQLSDNENDMKLDMISGILKTKDNKTWIPKERREKFISDMHRKLCHAGVRKVTEYIKTAYDMEEMQICIKNTIQSCDICQKRKTLTSKTKEFINVSPVVEPFETISIDFCGPFRPNAQGKRYILGIIDHCSRYISLSAVRNQDETTTSKILMNNWILKFGAPKQILSDCGKTFESRIIKELAEKYQIKLQYSSPYHHNTNGIIERQFRTIRDYLSASIKDKLRKDWVDILSEIEFTLNSTVQQTIGKSPAEVIFGFKLTREWEPNIRKHNIRNTIVKEMQEKTKNIKYNISSRTQREFNIGAEVLVKVDNRSKEEDRFHGPFTIVNKEHERKYVLKDKNGKVFTRNVEWLKPFKQGGCKEEAKD